MTLKVGKDDMTFSWRNYTKPTPRNLLRFSELIQGILLGVSTGSMFTEAPSWVPICLNISVVIVNRVVMFFGSVVEDQKQETATAHFPSGDSVTMTKDQPEG